MAGLKQLSRSKTFLLLGINQIIFNRGSQEDPGRIKEWSQELTSGDPGAIWEILTLEGSIELSVS